MIIYDCMECEEVVTNEEYVIFRDEEELYVCKKCFSNLDEITEIHY